MGRGSAGGAEGVANEAAASNEVDDEQLAVQLGV